MIVLSGWGNRLPAYAARNRLVQSGGNFTAALDRSYVITATATVTDPSPSEGKGFVSLVRNGTATVGGTAYAIAGTLIDRSYHSGSWGSYVYPHLAGAWTWTAAQTVDRGTGALPSPINSGNQLLTLANSNNGSSNIEGFGFASTGVNFRARIASGTRASPTAVADGQIFLNLACGGYDGTTWQTDPAYIRTFADGLWSGSNRGAYHTIGGTANGSTTVSEWVRLQNAMLGIGVIPAASGGSLQLGTGSANGIGFQSGGVVDARVYRSAAGVVTTDGAFKMLQANAGAFGAGEWSRDANWGTYYKAPAVGNSADIALFDNSGLVSLQIYRSTAAAGVNAGIVAQSNLTAGVSEGFVAGLNIAPTYSGAFTVTRHNYSQCLNPVLLSSAIVIDACLVRFDAAAGAHKAVDSGTTKTTPGAVNAWVKINVNGAIHYIPSYTSKTT